jgi:hypothetical protein
MSAVATAENLQNLANQARLFGDPAWLREQSAGDLAILHRIMTDRAFSILSAWRPAGLEATPGEGLAPTVNGHRPAVNDTATSAPGCTGKTPIC